MSEQLKYIREAYDCVKALQHANAELHARIAEASNTIPNLEIQDAFDHTRGIDDILTEELEQIGEAYERTKAELEATDDPTEDGFQDFIAHCLANIQDRSDLVADGSVVTFTVTQEGPNGNRSMQCTLRDVAE